MKYLGLRVEEGQHRCALLSLQKKRIQVHELTTYPSKKDFFRKRRSRNLVCALAEKDVLIKRVNTPNNTLRILKKTLPFQIDTHFELPVERFLFHPFTCYTDTTFIGAASAEAVDTLVSTYNPVCISSEQSALLHFVKAYAEEYHSLCIVYVQKKRMVCLTLDRGNYGRSYTFPCEDIRSACANVLSFLPTKRSVPLLLLGTTSLRKELIEEIEKQEKAFEIVSLSLNDAEYEYALEIGLALEGLQPDTMSMQFRKGERLPQKEKRRFVWSLCSVAVAGMALCASIFFAFSTYHSRLTAQLGRDASHLRAAYPTLYEGVSKKNEAVDIVASMRRLQKKIPHAPHFLNEFPGASAILHAVTATAEEKNIEVGQLDYTLSHYPTAKQPGTKYAGHVHCFLKITDPIRAKEFCDALAENPWFARGQGLALQRDTYGFTIICPFTE